MIGHLGADAEVRDVSPGQKVISFRIAHSERFTDRSGQQVERTTWVNCSYFRPADRVNVANYLRKGTQVYVEGVPDARHYVTRDGQNAVSLECRILSLELLGGGNRGEATGATASSYIPQQANANPTEGTAFNPQYSPNLTQESGVEDDLPF